MPLTPAQVRGVAFNKPPRGKRGYHEDEVDAFVDVVAAELARLLEQHTDLRTQLAQRDQQPTPGAIDTAAAPRAPASPPMRQPPSADADESHHHAARVLNLAQQTADRVTSQATADAEALLSQAHAHAEQLLCQARTTAEALISEATTRVETILHDARTRADTVEQQSRDKVDKVASAQQEVLRQHTEIITALGADKTALENSIEHLHAFDSDYRTHLMRFVHAQLHQLGAQELAGPADLTSTQQAPVAAGSGTRPKTSVPRSSRDQHRWQPAVNA
jgi:DivIVA domain-containing protein